KAQRVGDAPACRGVQHDKALILRRDLSWQSVPFQDALIEAMDGLHQWDLDLQSRRGNRGPRRFPKLRHDHLLGLIDRIQRTAGNEHEQYHQDDQRCDNAIHLTSPSLLKSQGPYRPAGDPGTAAPTTAAHYRTHTSVSRPGESHAWS